MAADTNKSSMASLSSAQLAERLEKSEAGRKKLRQAISILQEKLDATEKVLKVNDTLRQECEQERRRAESEKKKAEEERRLRSILEKDSATFKDQLAKVFQRLGAVENKQKTDKKELERVRNEVKLSVEGMRVASQAVDALQNSFQTLENNVLEKVNSAFEEVHAASQAVRHVQSALQSLENTVVKKGASPDNVLGLPKAKPAPEKLLNDISRLFNRERQSHCRIEQRLSMLKSVLKSGGLKQKETQRDSTAQLEKTDVCRGSLKNTIVQNEGSSEAQPEDDSELTQCRWVDKLADQEENPERGLNASSAVHCDDINDVSDFDIDFFLSYDSEDEWWSKERTLLSPSLPEIPSPSCHSPSPSREPSPSRGFSDSKVGTDASFDLFSSVNHEVPVRDASPLAEIATKRVDVQGSAVVHSSKSIETRIIMPLYVSSQRSSSILSNSTLQQPDSAAGVEEQPNSNRKIELNTGFVTSQLVLSDTCTEMGVHGSKCQVLSVTPNQDAGINVCETSTGALEAASPDDPKNAFQEICTIPTFIPTTVPQAGSLLLADKQEEETQFDEDYTFEAVDNANITEISNFLEVLPPISSVFPDEFCASELPIGASEIVMSDGDDTRPSNSIGPSDKVCASSQRQALCEMQMLKPIDMKPSVNIGEESHDIFGIEHTTNLSNSTVVQALPIQEKALDIEGIKDKKSSRVLERSSGLDPQAVLTLNTKPSSSFVVFLLHAFSMQEVDVAVKVTAACIIAINFRGYLPHANADKEKMKPQVTTLSRASANVPLEYLACSFISSAVDLVRLEKGEQLISETQSINGLVQAFVAFVSSMFKEKANIIFDNIFAQLGRFLTQGEAMLITLHGLISPCEDALSVARMIHDKKHHSYQYTEATLKDIHAGGKVLAALCQVLSCVTHLQHVVYEVLGWCDKDIMWLLTVFSSFSSICGDTAFMVEADDLLGRAICAIIIELVASVEQEYMRRADCTIGQATQGLPDGSPNLPMEWAALKESLEVKGKFVVEEVFLAVLEAFQCIFSSTHESLVPASLKNKTKHIHTRMWEGIVLSDREAINDPIPCQDTPIVHESMQNPLSVKQRDFILKNLDSEKWQKKYVEAVEALELISQFMGWEWTYNHLIVRCLWKMVLSGSAQLCVAGVSHILSILMRIGVKGGGTDLPGLAELKKCLVHIVQSTSTFMGKTEPFLLSDLQ